jgi:hypothetical protein
VAFELTVLFSAFTTVFAMLGLNGLPRFSNPVFSNPKFDRTTDDRFFLWIDSRDKYFNSDKVKALLSSTGAKSVEEVREDDSSERGSQANTVCHRSDDPHHLDPRIDHPQHAQCEE